MQLYIANQNYSTWSLRAWVCLVQNDVDAEIIKLTLFTDEFYQKLAQVSPAAKVPALVDGDIVVWDSLAIAEYLNESYLDNKGWPSLPAERAKARAISAEMHSGFNKLA